MPKEKRDWGILFTDIGRNELEEEFKPYFGNGVFGVYLICKDVDMSHPHLLRIVVDSPDSDEPSFEIEFFVPYPYIKLIAVGTEEKVNKVVGFRKSNK